MMLKLMAMVAVFLTGCAAPQFAATVSVRHNLASSPAAQRFAFERNASQVQSLAQRDFEEDVSAELMRKGYVYEPNMSAADWLVRLQYQVDGGKTVTSQEPIWGTVGFSTYYRRVSTSNGVVLVPYTRTESGVIGSRPVSDTVYSRQLTLDILDRKDLAAGRFAKLFEGKAVNRSSDDAIEPAVPWLIRALFEQFPGVSGSNREVKIILPEQ
ncbi:DUF4136 domain-containing protein [Iodobacter sp. HSC-16F04]|uniref:DUF4136 domain-containing protein n=1 Tax=Iodobacter violaceini TaxID=3044271 RepID=A0ABX0KXB0_9NEIS|nr:DUF4136 domain-containing protein [Iodobacter violacea]NHQ88652.1 DUF4136 domain-containing protein [Iodobacter violacea]